MKVKITYEHNETSKRTSKTITVNPPVNPTSWPQKEGYKIVSVEVVEEKRHTDT